MTQTAIEIKHLNRIFKLDSVEVVALHDVNLSIPAADFFALMGLRGRANNTAQYHIRSRPAHFGRCAGRGCRDAAHERKASWPNGVITPSVSFFRLSI